MQKIKLDSVVSLYKKNQLKMDKRIKTEFLGSVCLQWGYLFRVKLEDYFSASVQDQLVQYRKKNHLKKNAKLLQENITVAFWNISVGFKK